jgi:hypothetical protein
MAAGGSSEYSIGKPVENLEPMLASAGAMLVGIGLPAGLRRRSVRSALTIGQQTRDPAGQSCYARSAMPGSNVQQRTRTRLAEH